MTKQKLMDRIMQLNRSARAEFLAEFSEAELQRYLTNLEAVWDAFKSQFVTATSDFVAQEEPEPALAGS